MEEKIKVGVFLVGFFSCQHKDRDIGIHFWVRCQKGMRTSLMRLQ